MGRRRAVGIAAVVLLVVIPAWGAGRALVVEHELTSPDALISLGSHESERLPAVARLARRSPRALVLLTEPVQPTPFNCQRCSERVEWLASLGTPFDRIVVLPRRVTNTLDEAVAVNEYRKVSPIRRLLVVTSPYHSRRAQTVFAAVLGGNVRVGVYPTLEDSPARPTQWWRERYDREYVPYEWMALAWYGVRYGINPLAVVARGSRW